MDPSDEQEGIDLEYLLEDLAVDPATRVAGAILIILGSLLGTQLGIMLISADPGEVLSGRLDSTDTYADISGIVNSALIDNTTGGV